MKFSLNKANIDTHFGIEIIDYCGKDNPYNMDCAIAKFRNSRYPWKINHNFEEMFFILEGECVIEFQDETVTLEKGDVYIIPSEKKHSTHAIYADILIACSPPFNLKNIEFIK